MPRPSLPPELEIEARQGWPPDLRWLVERYPRAAWRDHVNLGELARFWLQIHDGFRAQAKVLESTASDFREGRMTPNEFRAVLVPRLRIFLTHLNGHHQIEDFQFFPLFAAAEPRLARGFDVLEADHEAIHRVMDEMVVAANALIAPPEVDSNGGRRLGDTYAGVGDHLIRLLARHLDDEEDLIIPLILDRGENDLGL
jgi:iron-sulfur cluster repair protein YtfE (RIC family)